MILKTNVAIFEKSFLSSFSSVKLKFVQKSPFSILLISMPAQTVNY